MTGHDALSPNYLRLSFVALVAAVGFGGSILVLGSGVTWLHETAGAVLLVLIAGTLFLGWRARATSPGAAPRAAVGLVLLVAMGLSGAALALGAVPASDQAIPGVVLVGLIVLLAEMVRFARASGTLRRGPVRPNAD